MQLILIAEHPTKGPQIILSFPRNLSDTICSHLFRLFHVHEKEVTITDLVDETPAIHELFFIPTASNPNGQKVMLSAILKKKIDAPNFLSLFEGPCEKLRRLTDLYQIIISSDAERQHNPILMKKMHDLSDILAVFFDKLRTSLENPVSQKAIAL